MSGWIGRVDDAKQPRNAVTTMFVFGALLLCTILPSQVAFTSLISAGGVPTTAAYGLIALLRLTLTPDDFKSSHFYLGKWRKPFYLCAVLFNGLIFAVCLSRLCGGHCAQPSSRPKSRRSSSPSPRNRSTSYVYPSSTSHHPG